MIHCMPLPKTPGYTTYLRINYTKSTTLSSPKNLKYIPLNKKSIDKVITGQKKTLMSLLTLVCSLSSMKGLAKARVSKTDL